MNLKLGGLRQSIASRTTFGKIVDVFTNRPAAGAALNYNVDSHLAFNVSYFHVFNWNKKRLFKEYWVLPGINAVMLGARITFL